MSKSHTVKMNLADLPWLWTCNLTERGWPIDGVEFN